MVEHSLGKGEVESSIPSGSTRFPKHNQDLGFRGLPCVTPLRPEHAANVCQKLSEKARTLFACRSPRARSMPSWITEANDLGNDPFVSATAAASRGRRMAVSILPRAMATAVTAVVQMKDRRRPFVEDRDDELVCYLQNVPLEIVNAVAAEHLATHGRINVRPTIETISPIVSKLQNWPRMAASSSRHRMMRGPAKSARCGTAYGQHLHRVERGGARSQPWRSQSSLRSVDRLVDRLPVRAPFEEVSPSRWGGNGGP